MSLREPKQLGDFLIFGVEGAGTAEGEARLLFLVFLHRREAGNDVRAGERRVDFARLQRELARLPSAHYAPLFKESLTEATLLSLLNALDTALKGSSGAAEVEAAGSTATQVLEGLASTRRFGMLLMFLDAKQKAVVKTVFGQLAKLGTPASAALKGPSKSKRATVATPCEK